MSSVSPLEGGCRVDMNQEARNRIDEEIRKLQGQILDLCTARNRLAPITTLPVEVLTRIFLFTRHLFAGYGSSHSSLTVSWVCRDWRAAALGLPQLWDVIDASYPALVGMLLQRSKEVGLGMFVKLLPDDGSVYYAVVKSLPRLYALHFDGRLPEGKTVIRCTDAWDVPVPMLRELSLTNFKLSDNMFSGIYPSLCELHLISCEAKWKQFPISPTLTNLRVISPNPRTSVIDLIDILQSLPNLERLELSQALLDDGGAGSNDPKRLSLPKLERFKLELETCRAAIALSSRLSIPSTTEIFLKLCAEEPDELLDVVLAIQATRPQPAFDIIGLNILVKHNHTFRFLCIETDSKHKSLGTTIFEFIPEPGLADELSAQSIMDVCHSLHLASLNKLTIQGRLGYDPGLWENALGSLPNLTDLVIRGHFAHQFVRYLEDEADKLLSTGEKTTTPPHQPAFRGLKNLTLSNLCHSTSDQDLDDIGRLRWALGPRKIYLERLPQLELETRGSPLPDDILTSFKHVVDKVSQRPVPSSLWQVDDEDLE